MTSELLIKTRTNKAYKLDWDITHLDTVKGEPPMEEAAWQLNFPNHPGTGFYSTLFFDFFPNPIEFGSTPWLLSETDYPYTDIRWPVMSKRMLDVLLSVGSFPHRTYPVVMIDQSMDSNSKELKIKGTKNYDYVLVQPSEYLDAFDFENSIFKWEEYDPSVVTDVPSFVSDVERLVLKEIDSDFPPLFTVEESSLDILVSAKARAALEAANIKGIMFTPVGG
jgi:hypothetical protein